MQESLPKLCPRRKHYLYHIEQPSVLEEGIYTIFHGYSVCKNPKKTIFTNSPEQKLFAQTVPVPITRDEWLRPMEKCLPISITLMKTAITTQTLSADSHICTLSSMRVCLEQYLAHPEHAIHVSCHHWLHLFHSRYMAISQKRG